MAMQRTKLADIQYVGSSAGSIFNNPPSTKTYIKGFIIHNNNTTAETVKLYNVPDSGSSVGSAAAGNKFFEQAVQTLDTLVVIFDYPIVLTDENDSIQAVTTTASKVTIQILGDKDA